MNKKNISLAKRGMNRSTYPSQLEQQEYTFALNANMEDLGGETFALTDEQSNILASKFKDGFVVVGFKNSVKLNRTFFFLTNLNTGISEFGYIQNIDNFQDVVDIETSCSDCDYKNILSEPLEESIQVPYQQYITLLTDCVDNKCFNLSAKHPIKKIEIKIEKTGTIIVFTDNFNPPRYIQLDNLSIYSYTGEIICSDDDTVPTCLACDKLKIFRDFYVPGITPSEIILGGRLKMGRYQFLIAYSDEIGNEISEYYALTNPIDIFDTNNSTLEQENLADRTNFSIKLNITDLDKDYTHYKIVVVQIADINNATSYFVEGLHPINDNIVIYSTEEDKERIDISKLIKQNIFVTKWEGLTQSNNYLFGYGVEVEKEMNLQPVVNLMGQFLRWQTHIAPEDLYENGVNISLFLGYNRDETVPFGIKFYSKNGWRSANFPFIGRAPLEADLAEVPEENLDRLSIESNLINCSTNGRTKRWQFYNDATEEGYCGSSDIETIEVEEEVTKICYVEDIAESVDGTFTVDLNEPFDNLLTYIEDNRDSCPDAFGTSDLCDMLDITNYEAETCGDGLFEGNCGAPELVESTIEVVSITGDGEDGGELFEGVEKVFPDDYSKLQKPDFCSIYKIEYSTGNNERDTEFEYLYMYKDTTLAKIFFKAYARDYNFSNEDCPYADDIVDMSNGSSYQAYFNNYLGAEDLADLQSSKSITDVAAITTEFTDKVHKGALWFKAIVDGRTSLILEVSKQNNPTGDDDINTGSINSNQEVRISIFNRCTSSTALYSQIVSLLDGAQYKIDIVAGGFNIDDGINTPTFIAEANLFPNGNFYVSVDNPIYEVEGVEDATDPQGSALVTKYRTAPTDGCFSIVTRDVEFSEATISWNSIVFRKKSVYTAICIYEQPIIQKCTAVPFKYGKFAYTESEENYPDNAELFNSQVLQIKPGDLPVSIVEEFSDTFVDSINGDNYVLNDATNYSCKPIRHFKLPDNKVSPFMYENQQAPFNQSVIYPLGVTINENVINAFLDIAVNNELITQEQRDSIVKYEIVRGDINNDRSIQASGLLYDVRSYKEKSKDVYYSNYPFNDLGKDKLNIDSEEDNIEENNKFTFHSPETDYYKGTLPSEMSVQGYMFGKSKGVFDEVKDHPKWVILSSKAKNLANLLASIEVQADIAVKIAQSAEAWRFYAGFVFSANPVGAAYNIIVGVLATLEGVLVSFGRYRYEWLKIFRDLGQPQNFAYYYYAEGNYNYLRTLQEDEQSLRSLNVAKKLKPNKSFVIDENLGTRMTINNIDREESVFISTGDFPIVYVPEYATYDNNSVDFNSSSITFASESNDCIVGKSSDILRNIASPYVALKNFISSQYGVINSVRWVSTGHVGDLTNPTSDCLPIFGGDTFIGRHTVKRKIPIFLTDAMNIASLTPFNYSFYSNIGSSPKFYADYELNKDFARRSTLFPDIDSDYKFDCYKRSGNYIVPPSKFYLYYYGVPNFLCESRINTNFRYGKPELGKSFFPDVGDIGDWTQQKDVPIKTRNYFFYNEVYSRRLPSLNMRTLPDSYSKVIYDVTYDKPNGVMYSLPDNEENNLNEPWLIYRPFDFYEFPTSYGKLKDLRGIESSQVLGRFENQTAIFNSVDVTVETGQQVTNNNLGNGGIFARRPVTFSETDLGYMGSQTSEMISCEFGHFFVDAKRGYVFKINPGGKGIEEISSYIGGKPSGMSHWFKEHLPFKILKSGIEDIELDNAMNGIGITMGWDSRFKRVFITKKDYKLNAQYVGDVTYEDGNFIFDDGVIELTDTEYFTDVSWTIAFSATLNSWLSYYDFKPNYYIAHNNYFQTGLNKQGDEFGLWSHLITNKSYFVFYGKKYNFEIEYPDKNLYNLRTLSSVNLWTEARRYNEKYNFSYSPDITFNKSIIFNNVVNSGLLILVPQKNSLVGNKNYPKLNNDNSQQILISNKDNFEWSYDYFYNRVKNNVSNEPNWIWDDNQIVKTVNPRAVSFVGKRVLDRLEGDYFLVNLKYDKDSRFKLIHKWGTQDYQ